MPNLIVFILTATSIIISIAVVVDFPPSFKKAKLTLTTISLLLISWTSIYLLQDWRYIKGSISIETVFGRDMFEYNECIYNANAVFRKDFEDGQKVDILIRDMGPYYGIFSINENLNLFKLNENE